MTPYILKREVKPSKTKKITEYTFNAAVMVGFSFILAIALTGGF